MTLRRILLGLNLSKDFPYRNRLFSSASVRYPLGKDPSSLPSGLTEKLGKNPNFFTDDRPVSLRYRVNLMIELCQLDKAAEISRLAVLEIYRNDGVLICIEIIGAMCGAKRYDEAKALFHYFFNESNIIPNIVSFNHIIKAHCDENGVEEALQLFHHARDFDPNAGRIPEAVGIVQASHLWDSVVYSYLIRGFLDQGNHDKADQLFNRLIDEKPEYEIYDYDDIAMVDATFVDCWFTQGNDKLAMEIYRSILPNEDCEFIYATTGNTLLKTLLDHRKISEAWKLFEDMINNARHFKDHVTARFLRKSFDSETINIMVNECFKLGNFEEAKNIFHLGASFAPCYSSNIIERSSAPCYSYERSSDPSYSDERSFAPCYSNSIERSVVPVYRNIFDLGASFAMCYINIIERFCERGMMSEAEALFEEMCEHKDLVLSHQVPTFSSMINGYVKVGRMDDAQRMLKKMFHASLLKVSIHQVDWIRWHADKEPTLDRKRKRKW